MTHTLDDAHLAVPLGTGCRLGSHRVIEPKGALPQAAWRSNVTGLLKDSQTHLQQVYTDLSNIANAKAVYVAEHWQDSSRAKQWASDAAQVDTLADTLERAWAILAFEANERARDALNSD